jgi:hypothetical protein
MEEPCSADGGMTVAKAWAGLWSARMLPAKNNLDLELIAQRILKLAEIAMLEHLEQLLNSQAQGVLMMAQESETA